MKITRIVQGLALAGLASAALAQTGEQRITITGSSIKRIATEGALPVQVITRADLEREGVTSAEQAVMQLTSSGTGLDNLASNADVVEGAARGNNGSSSANLRGQGANATLILVNGRRVAAHGLNGGVVDLNQIPLAAIDRIEILKDGASAIYGTDAIGGVINFILRTNFTGLRAQAIADVTEAGGGNIFRGSLTGGFGDLERDGFNVLGVLSYSDNKALRANQRDFVNTFQSDRGLSPDTRGTPFATIFPLAGTLFPAAANTPFVPGSTTVRASGGINILDLPGGLGCGAITDQAPYDERLWASPTSALACAWDTGRAMVLQQPITKTNLVLRGQFKLGANHLVTAEAMASHTESAKRFSNFQMIPNATTQQARFPRNADSQAAYDMVFNALLAAFPGQIQESQRGQSISYRWRCIECGEREILTESDAKRLFLGIEGVLPFGWDYKAGVSQADSKPKSTLGGGYYYRGTTATGALDGTPGLIPALNTGKINVFLLPGQTQSAAGLAELEKASARGVVLYGGKYTTTQLDYTMSGSLFKLPGGDAMAALGVDLRTEKYRFNGDERPIDQRPVILAAPFDDANALPGVKRDVKAVFAELLLPVTKTIETTLAVRHDEYDGFGGSTNPKISGLWRPSNQFLMRASYSTGFRVPTFNQLYNPATESASGVDRVDPATCPTLVVNPAIAGCEAIRPGTINGGKPDLGPEEAKMWSAGFIVEPLPNLSIGMDWWRINRIGAIQVLAIDTLYRNYALFPERFLRNPAGQLIDIDNRWVNSGETQTEGVDVTFRGGLNALGARWTVTMDGTYLLKKRSRLLANSAWGASEVGVFSFGGDLGLRWKHNLYLTYQRGDWSATLGQFFRKGYLDQVLPGVLNGTVTPPNWNPKVGDYVTYGLSLTYSGIKNLTLTGVVKNLTDKDPPFTVNYNSNLGSNSSWDARVADPRGRAYVLNLEYKFF